MCAIPQSLIFNSSKTFLQCWFYLKGFPNLFEIQLLKAAYISQWLLKLQQSMLSTVGLLGFHRNSDQVTSFGFCAAAGRALTWNYSLDNVNGNKIAICLSVLEHLARDSNTTPTCFHSSLFWKTKWGDDQTNDFTFSYFLSFHNRYLVLYFESTANSFMGLLIPWNVVFTIFCFESKFILATWRIFFYSYLQSQERKQQLSAI